MSAYARAGRFIGRLWAIIRHLLAARGLLQWTGWWETVTAMVASPILAVWSVLKGVPAPVAVVIGITAFVVTSAAWRTVRPQPPPEKPPTPVPPVSGQSPPSAGAAAPKPVVILEYSVVGPFSSLDFINNGDGMAATVRAESPELTFGSNRIKIQFEPMGFLGPHDSHKTWFDLMIWNSKTKGFDCRGLPKYDIQSGVNDLLNFLNLPALKIPLIIRWTDERGITPGSMRVTMEMRKTGGPLLNLSAGQPAQDA